MQTENSKFDIFSDRATVTKPGGKLLNAWSSSPKSPKFNELLSKHHALQRPEQESELSVKTEDGGMEN